MDWFSLFVIIFAVGALILIQALTDAGTVVHCQMTWRQCCKARQLKTEQSCREEASAPSDKVQ